MHVLPPARSDSEHQGAALDISGVIVNWNALPFLGNLFSSLYNHRSGILFEVLIVDNASHDGCVALVQGSFPQAQIIPNGHNAGFARANNQAIRRSKGRYVLLLNPETVVSPGRPRFNGSFLRQSRGRWRRRSVHEGSSG